MRKLKTKDIALFCSFMKTAKARDTVMQLLRQVSAAVEARKAHLAAIKELADAGDTQAAEDYESASADYNWMADIGIEGAMILMESVGDKTAQDALCRFFGSAFDCTAADIWDMDADVLKEKIAEMFAVNDMLRFFSSAPKMGS